MQVTAQALQEVEQALRKYEEEVGQSRLTEATKQTYLLHGEQFRAVA